MYATSPLTNLQLKLVGTRIVGMTPAVCDSLHHDGQWREAVEVIEEGVMECIIRFYGWPRAMGRQCPSVP